MEQGKTQCTVCVDPCGPVWTGSKVGLPPPGKNIQPFNMYKYTSEKSMYVKEMGFPRKVTVTTAVSKIVMLYVIINKYYKMYQNIL